MKWHGETERQVLNRYSKGVKCWAWFPTQMNCGAWVWWEPYWSGLHTGMNNRKRWVNALIRDHCVQCGPTTTPPPKR
jgi:hypothetical protein